MATIEQRLEALERAIRNSRITPQLPALINVDGDELINLWSFSQNKLVQYPYADVIASGSVDPTNDILPVFKQMPNPDFSLDMSTQIASYINNETDFKKTGSQVIFYFVTRKIVNADSDSGFDFQREFYLLAKGKGTYGATSGVTILSQEVVKQTPNIDANGSIQQINLNATVPYDIEMVVNGSTAFTPIPSATILFNIAVGGGNEYYLYQGPTNADMGTSGYVSVVGDYIDLQTANSDPNPVTSENVYLNTNNATETIGGFLEGEPITPPQGLTFTSMWNKLFSSIIPPTISFNVNNQTVEIGSDYNKIITITFNQNDAGAANLFSLNKDGLPFQTVEGNNFPGLDFTETNVLNSFTLQAFVTYNASSNLSGGTINTPLRTITPKYKYWVYSGSENTSPTASASIRALTINGFVPANSVSVVIPQGDTEVTIYVKQTSTLQSVIYVESSNADITANFAETLVTVNDANGTAVQYNKLTQKIGGTGYTANATYLITITE